MIWFSASWIFTILPNSDRKSTRLNSSHLVISYAVFCLKKKKKNNYIYICSATTCVTVYLHCHLRDITPDIDHTRHGCTLAFLTFLFFFFFFFFLGGGPPPNFPFFPPPPFFPP